jgi:cupin 2 domain-containing protein
VHAAAGNVFAAIPPKLDAELFETLAASGAVRIERIVSRGHASPASGCYDQDEHEWVIVLRGWGRLEFRDGQEVALDAGGWIEIPAHRRHRVAWTDPDDVTVWLAVFYRASE